MGLFGNSTSIEQAVGKNQICLVSSFSNADQLEFSDLTTDGKRTSEDWQEILEIVDQIEQQPNGYGQNFGKNNSDRE
jgi:DNA-binding PucR family transcriptional regulator